MGSQYYRNNSLNDPEQSEENKQILMQIGHIILARAYRASRLGFSTAEKTDKPMSHSNLTDTQTEINTH